MDASGHPWTRPNGGQNGGQLPFVLPSRSWARAELRVTNDAPGLGRAHESEARNARNNPADGCATTAVCRTYGWGPALAGLPPRDWKTMTLSQHHHGLDLNREVVAVAKRVLRLQSMDQHFAPLSREGTSGLARPEAGF
jgi:hypothetical protein